MLKTSEPTSTPESKSTAVSTETSSSITTKSDSEKTLFSKTTTCHSANGTVSVYYYEYDGIYFKQYKDDSYDNHLCSNPQYKNMTIGEFLKNCGTGPVPKDVAVKYCHLGIQFELGELVTEFSVNYSGWVGEDFVFDFANDDSH